MAFAFLGFSAITLSAHDTATLDAIPSAHGGQVRMIGPYHVELVLERNVARTRKPIWIFLQDHMFQPMPTAGLTATITIDEGSSSSAVTLRPDRPDSLFGIGTYSDEPALSAIVSIQDQARQAYTVTFTPFNH
jgi:hypothetical protein